MVAGVLLGWGHSFVTSEVHTQVLSAFGFVHLRRAARKRRSFPRIATRVQANASRPAGRTGPTD